MATSFPYFLVGYFILKQQCQGRGRESLIFQHPMAAAGMLVLVTGNSNTGRKCGLNLTGASRTCQCQCQWEEGGTEYDEELGVSRVTPWADVSWSHDVKYSEPVCKLVDGNTSIQCYVFCSDGSRARSLTCCWL